MTNEIPDAVVDAAWAAFIESGREDREDMRRALTAAYAIAQTAPQASLIAHGVEDGGAVATAPSSANKEWQPIENAPRDGTIIWVCFRNDLDQNGRNMDLKPWNGLQLPLRMRYPWGSDYTSVSWGWDIAAPIGRGGFPDRWIAGWIPLPEAPTS